jgi:hypothetical protein
VLSRRPPARTANLDGVPLSAFKTPAASPTHLSSSPSRLAACCTSSWGRAAQVGARVEPGGIVGGLRLLAVPRGTGTGRLRGLEGCNERLVFPMYTCTAAAAAATSTARLRLQVPRPEQPLWQRAGPTVFSVATLGCLKLQRAGIEIEARHAEAGYGARQCFKWQQE